MNARKKLTCTCKITYTKSTTKDVIPQTLCPIGLDALLLPWKLEYDFAYNIVIFIKNHNKKHL